MALIAVFLQAIAVELESSCHGNMGLAFRGVGGGGGAGHEVTGVPRIDG